MHIQRLTQSMPSSNKSCTFSNLASSPIPVTCDRAHLFKIGAESLHTSNTRINKAYKELIKKGIIKIIKESGFRGSSKHEIIINENDTAIQLLAIQKRITYFEKTGKKHFPDMFKEDFMINNFEDIGACFDNLVNLTIL
jgi:hypothetical protein